MSSLKDRAVSSVKWNAVKTFFEVLLNPLVLIVLARILSPEEFGLIAIVTIIMGFSKRIARMGFSKAIIQKDNIDEGDLSSIFWFEQVIGILTFGIIYFFAPIIVSFFDAPDAVFLIQVSAFVFLFEPIDLVFRALLKKKLKFDLLTKANLLRIFFNKSSVIIFAVLGYGALSYVIGRLIGIFVLTIILTYYFYRHNLWLPKLQFSFKRLKPYLSFGIYIVGKSICNNLFNYADEIIIGGSLGSEALGIYHFAKRIIKYLMRLLNTPISQVSYPLLSKINKNRNRFNKNYIRVIKYIGSMSIPAYTGMALTASLFIPFFFGQEWMASITIVVILCFWGLFKSLYSGIISSALYSFGKSNWVFYATLIDLPLRALALYWASFYNLEYVAAVLGLIGIVKFLIYQIVLRKLTGIRVREIIYSLKFIFLSTGLMGIILYLLMSMLAVNILPKLTISILTGIIIYAVVMIIFEKEYVISSIKMLKSW